MIDPFNKPEQPWEKMRHDVAQQREDGDSVERRVVSLEKRVNHMEVLSSTQLEGMSVAIQHLLKVMDKLVTKDQVDSLRIQVNGLWISVAIGVAVFLFKR